ncbi:MAG TPA: hypothetical protein VEJ44_05755, partial [Acidimicrobiales bacterium]|nr:hypothetical protein [Acidimicrobiales bacterium]
QRPVAWLVADDGTTVSEVPEVDGGPAGDHGMGVVLYEEGRATVGHLLAEVHQHGAWIDWREASTT